MKPQNEEAKEPQGKLTITAELAKQSLFKTLGAKEQDIIGRVIYAGMKFMFTKEMNDKIVEGIQKTMQSGKMDISDVLGVGTGHTMIALYNESKGTMPVGALLPAGYVLLAKLFEFVNDTKMYAVTDEEYGEALQMMNAVINRVLNPRFNSDLAKQGMANMAQGQQGQPTQQPPSPPGMLAQPAQSQPGA